MINYQNILKKQQLKKQRLQDKIDREQRHLDLHVKDWQTKIQFLLDQSDLQELEKELYVLEYRADLQQYM